MTRSAWVVVGAAGVPLINNTFFERVLAIKMSRRIEYRPMQTRRPQLLVATNNPGKLREFRDLFIEMPLEMVGLDSLDNVADVEETGSTFAENAALKARG